jgi:hypothetical protein
MRKREEVTVLLSFLVTNRGAEGLPLGGDTPFWHPRLVVSIFGVISILGNPTIQQSGQRLWRHQHFRKRSPSAPSTLSPTLPGRGAVISIFDFALANILE